MTNARTFLVQLGRRSLARWVAVALIAAPLAGCETGSNVLGGNTLGAGTSSAAVSAPSKAKLAFAPIVGAPAAVADMLKGSIVSAMQKQNVPVAASAAEVPDYTVRGYVVAAPDKAGTKLSYIWDVTDKTGQRAKRITGEEILKGKKGKDPWAQVDQSIVDKIAAATSTQLIAWVPMTGGGAASPPGVAPAASSQPAAANQPSLLGSIFGLGSTDNTASAAPAQPTPTPSQPSQPASLLQPKPGSLITGKVATNSQAQTKMASLQPGNALTSIAPIIGAPGDGATALTQALQRSLANSGVALSPSPAPGTVKVQGRVAMGQPAGGKQTIKIEWQVFDVDGTKKGTVSQNNVIPQGSLDGTWGKTADAAAAAAANGIVELIRKQAVAVQ